MQKALQAGSATDITGITGGQALQTQSLEGDVHKLVSGEKKIKIALPFVLEGIKNGTLKGNYDSFKKSLVTKGLSKKEADGLIRLIARNSAKISKALKS